MLSALHTIRCSMNVAIAVDAGYMFNISMLRRVFAPTFQLHDIKQTSEFDITTRWTMIMQLALNKYNPFRKWWDPQLLFTGTSIMSVNPSTGELCRFGLSTKAINWVIRLLGFAPLLLVILGFPTMSARWLQASEVSLEIEVSSAVCDTTVVPSCGLCCLVSPGRLSAALQLFSFNHVP